MAAQQQNQHYRPKLLRLPFSLNTLFKTLSLDAEIIAKNAQLPVSIFKQANSKISPEQYIRLWRTLESLCNDQSFGLTVTQQSLRQLVNLSLCAIIFSDNMVDAIKKLNDYQELMAPVNYHLEEIDDRVTIHVNIELPLTAVPCSYSYSILVYLVELLRSCTGHYIIPSQLRINDPDPSNPTYNNYFKITPESADSISLTLKKEELQLPFLTSNPQLWEFFGPVLSKRLALLSKSSRYTGKTKAYLYKNLASGNMDITAAAQAMSISHRTLQRRLKEEETTYRKTLDETRSELAFHYLSNTELPAIDISYLLGFEDKNSFFRAFQRWAGTTPQKVRNSLNQRVMS